MSGAKVTPLSLTGLPCGVFPVSLGLPGGFVFDNPSNAVGFGQFAGFGLGASSRCLGRFTFGSLGDCTFLLVAFRLLAFSLAGFAGLGDCTAFCLLCFAGRFGRLFGGFEGLKKRSLGICCSTAALGKLVVSCVSQYVTFS